MAAVARNDEKEVMRLRATFFAWLATCVVFATAATASATSPEQTYMAKVNNECKRQTAEMTAQLRVYTKAKTAGEQKTAGVAFVRMVLAGGEAYVRILNIPVPAKIDGKMFPIRLNMLGQVQAIQGMTKSKTDAEYRKFAGRLETLGAKGEKLFDAVGLLDCGRRQTRALAAAGMS